ncbi:amino acid ABC transporter permease [Derxia lacustris]|uniref:amino acid ABC transporter permease n=1 Tax=Derxia lacustris TaxID=764842 RepID=UPI000A16D3AD|nr:amino acid ABC transporter permease [Derxia lacustris]
MAYQWNWGVFALESATGDGSSYGGWLVGGLETTLVLSLAAWTLALLLGTAAGVLRTLPQPWARRIGTAYVELFRNVPLLVQLFIWYFVLPELLPESMGDALKQTSPLTQQFLAAFLCLGFFTSARVCEQVRAGIESLPRGQRNAGLAMGFTLGQTYRHVLLPVAFRVVIPPLTSEFLNIFKNSAVCSTIGLLELTAQGRQLVDYTSQPYESFIAVTLAYLAINVTVMAAMRWVESRSRIPGLAGQR